MSTFLRLRGWSGPWHRRVARIAVSAVAALALVMPLGGAARTPEKATAAAFTVATSDTEYTLCGRVFPDPHAYWPSPAQAPARSPFAKGNAVCAATDFLSYEQMVGGTTYLESLFPDFVEFYRLEEDFGTDADCAASVDPQDLCSAGLPQQGVPPGRDRSDLYLLRVTDERVPDDDKKLFTFPLSIHGIERAGAEAGVRAAEDLATWAACEAGLAPAVVGCAKEGAIPHPLLETTPQVSVSAGEALAQSAIYFVFANPDGWQRGDVDNGVRFYQRYNGNGVDMNRDWPTIGFTFRPYTPWSEPETRGFGRVMQEISDEWDGGIDLHGQLIDRAFSFTLLGAGEQDYAKNQRILQTVKGAWADAENRLAWSPLIKSNDAPADDPRLYGVQWGTVWDTIQYTTTGSFGDWINSPLGLNGDGIDNEMSLSHLSNCGAGSCYLPDPEQLHVDGNKSLIYSMVNFTLLPEETDFRVPGSVAYIHSPRLLTNDGTPTEPPPGAGLPAQDPILDASLDVANDFIHEFESLGFDEGVYNGGLEARATAQNVGGVGQLATTDLILERYRSGEEDPGPPTACGDAGDAWEEVNRYFDQSDIYQQSGAAVHANQPLPGRYRVCLTGGLVTKIRASGGSVDLDIVFSGEQAWEDPGQLPYTATNMKFFDDLAAHMQPGQLVRTTADEVLSGAVDLDRFSSVIVADDALPGHTEPPRTGEAQAPIVFSDVTLRTAATVPCAYSPGTQDVLPPTCVADFEYDVLSGVNNQSMTVALSADSAVDYDLYIERQSRISGEWFPSGGSATEAASEVATILRPVPGHYRVRVVNWAAGAPADGLEVSFSNDPVEAPPPPSERTDQERDAWGSILRTYAERGGNLVLTDGAIRDLAYMGLVDRQFVNDFSVYAGYIGFTRDGVTSTYHDPLAANVNQPGAAEGPGFRHQSYEPVPIGYAISPADTDSQLAASPVWSVDQIEWERLGGRTAGTTTADQATLGELTVGDGVVRIIGALLPMPTDRYYHPFGLANYALTYTGYQVLLNALQWERPAGVPDLVVSAMTTVTNTGAGAGNGPPRAGDKVTIRATIANLGTADAPATQTAFSLDAEPLPGSPVATGAVAAGAEVTVELSWDTRGLNGEHLLGAVADAADAVDETAEGNNAATLEVSVRGNKVTNGDFEQAAAEGSEPDAWTGSSSGAGSTAWSETGGTQGSRAVTITGTGRSVALAGMPSWTSAPIAVTAGQDLTLRASMSGSGLSSAPAAGLAYLGPAGELLSTVRLLEMPLATDGFVSLEQAVSLPPGVSAVRVVLFGFSPGDLHTAGTVTFDDIGLYAE
ncbi:MAG: CARDB domain-containing protein [Candidatus Limnocylindria bacterium]